MISATARPPKLPGSQASISAAACRTIHSTPSWRPLINTTMMGVPVSIIRWASCWLSPASAMSDRSQSSPQVLSSQLLRSECSPITTMARSDFRAAETASSTLDRLILRMFHPWSIKVNFEAGDCSSSPSRMVVTFSSGWGRAQSPKMVWLSALVPVTKTRMALDASSGRIPSLVSSTTDLTAAS